MSYNIRRFKLKHVSLTLPVGFKMEEFIAKHQPGTGMRDTPRIAVESDLKTWSFNCTDLNELSYCEGLSLKGEVTADGLKVTQISCYGTGSGHDYGEILLPLFKEFHGDLEAISTWEDGGRENLVITNGDAQQITEDD